jgi:hypothetical protein
VSDRNQPYRIMKTQPISLLSDLAVAIAVPVTLNAASLAWVPSKIAQDNGIVVLVELSPGFTLGNAPQREEPEGATSIRNMFLGASSAGAPSGLRH